MAGHSGACSVLCAQLVVMFSFHSGSVQGTCANSPSHGWLASRRALSWGRHYLCHSSNQPTIQLAWTCLSSRWTNAAVQVCKMPCHVNIQYETCTQKKNFSCATLRIARERNFFFLQNKGQETMLPRTGKSCCSVPYF